MPCLHDMLTAAILLAPVLFGGCESQLRILGSEPTAKRPKFHRLAEQRAQYQVWVLVPWLRVNTYPMKRSSQQPMLQFTGDLQKLRSGRGQLAALVAPERYRDGDAVRFFDDKVLWTERLEQGDRREFALWLRENNRSAPTKIDQQLRSVDQLAGAIEEISGVVGFKIPARRAIYTSAENLKRLERDWLILRWQCPWSHLLDQARSHLESDHRRGTLLQTTLESSERKNGKPVAEIRVVFVFRRIEAALPPTVKAEQ